MKIRWLKPYLPRSLYGRATLIMLVPVVTLFLVSSIVIVQRYFQGVTRQMTETASREVVAVLDEVAHPGTAPGRAPLTQTLSIAVTPVAPGDVPDEDLRRWFDLTGGIVIADLRRLFPDILAVELPNTRQVMLYFPAPPGKGGALRLSLDRRRVSASNAHQMLVNMVVFGVLITVIAHIYLRNQIRPITRLAEASEAFGRGRHLAYRPRGATEVRAAGNAFLNMRARIERQVEQRTLMLSGVSHDLRTPLTRLRLGLSLLDDPEAEPMLRDVDDMQRLLDEFLAFARGVQEGEPEPVDPVALLRQIVGDCQRADIAADLVAVETESPAAEAGTGTGEAPDTVMLRPIAIRRAVENLITNAVRYGSRAELSVHLSDKTLRIRVEDDGPGIPEDQREEAVKPFARLEPARNQNRGSGVGLGLAIATDIARAHGGTLRLGESARLGGLCADIVLAR